MIILITEIYHFEQLEKINPQLTRSILAGVGKQLGTYSAEISKTSLGTFLYQLGDEAVKQPVMLADAVIQIDRLLRDLSDDLYGYRLILAESDTTTYPIIQKKLLLFQGDDGLWLDKSIIELLDEHLVLEKGKDFWKVINAKASLMEEHQERAAIVARPLLINDILEKITPRLNGLQDAVGLAVLGASGFGVGNAVLDAASRILGEKVQVAPIRLFTLFKRQSPIHPFLNSVDLTFWGEAGTYLNPSLSSNWQQRKDVLPYLKNKTTGHYCFDSLLQDFILSYHLYVDALLNKAEKNLVPLLFVCDNVDTYHPDCRVALATLIKDFLHRPSFIPIVISTGDKLPRELEDIKWESINAEPPGWREVRDLADNVFPGLSLSRAVCRLILKATGGRITKVIHYLHYLESQGKIVLQDDRYVWMSRKDIYVDYPSTSLVATRHLLKNLSKPYQEILYSVCLASGLVDDQDLTRFLLNMGIPKERTEEVLKGLRRLYLISNDEIPLPLVSTARKILETLMAEKATTLRQGFHDFLLQLWKSGLYHSLILLYYYFRKNGLDDRAREIWPHIMKRRLDEANWQGASSFLKGSGIEIDTDSDEILGPGMALAAAEGQLRMLLAKGRHKPADLLVRNIMGLIKKTSPRREAGIMHVRLTSFHLSKGNPKTSLIEAKQALIVLEETGSRSDTAFAHFAMGTALLAEGDISEAIEYLEIADRFLPERSMEKLLCTSQTAIGFFLRGKADKALVKAQTAIRIASRIGRREWQLMMTFFEGRIRFYLGDYRNSIQSFQVCLSLARLYNLTDSQKVIRNWMARANVYSGNAPEGIRILKDAVDSKEALYFLSEAYFLSGRVRRALSICERGRKKLNDLCPYPEEIVFWQNGYASIENRCLALDAENSTLQRRMDAFHAYLLALNGYHAEGRRVLELLTRSQQIKEMDILSSHYFYLYSLVLPEFGGGDSVDRLTVLNIAWKLYQERLFSLESVKFRQVFSKANLWNKRLAEEARNRHVS